MILLMLFIVPLLTPSPMSQAEQDGLENLFLLGSFNTTTPAVFRTVCCTFAYPVERTAHTNSGNIELCSCVRMPPAQFCQAFLRLVSVQIP